MNEYIKNIIETIKEFNWNLKQIWVDDNCIYAEVEKINGKLETEGLYAGSDFDKEDVYRVFNKLQYVFKFNGMLINNNVIS
jgi:hypothetical protein